MDHLKVISLSQGLSFSHKTDQNNKTILHPDDKFHKFSYGYSCISCSLYYKAILSQTNSTLCQVSTCSEPCIACLVNYPILGNNTLSNFISFPRESKTFKFSIDLF